MLLHLFLGMFGKNKKEIKSLGLEFVEHSYQDEVKIGLIPAQLLLKCMCLWPDSSSAKIVFANWFLFCNLFAIECFHVYYAVLHYSDDAISAIATFATVTTTLEALVRIYSLMFKKHLINDMLHKMWKDFWPIAIANPRLKKSIKQMIFISCSLQGCFFFSTASSNVLITGIPFIKHHTLILNSEYPFRWNQTYVYEGLYVWQYFFDWFVLFTVNGFDFLFMPMVLVCAIQFRIVQEVFKEMFNETSKKHKILIFGKEGVSDKELLLKCLEQHELLLKMCTDLENSFNVVILIQYVTSTMSICSGTLAMMLDSNQFTKMLIYAVAHLVQLFHYCFVGQELTFQSSSLSDKIYECNWYQHYDRDFRKTMIMMIQRSQRECTLTAAGVTNLDYSGLLKVMRISFSCYTLFDKMLAKREL